MTDSHVHDDAPTPDEPDHVRRAREALLRPRLQFSLRMVFAATIVVATLSLGLRMASGGAVLSFLPLSGALIVVIAGLAIVNYWLRAEGVIIGGLATVCSVGFLAMIPLWLQEGIDQRMGRGRVSWELVTAGEIGRPFLIWLIVFLILAAIGMAAGAVIVAIHRAQRRRQIAAAPFPTDAEHKERRFLRARQEALLPRWRATTYINVALMALAALCALLLMGEYSAEKTSLACWLAAIGTAVFLLVFCGQLVRSPGIVVGGALMVLCFAVMSMLPLWRHGPGPPEPMLSYALRTRYEDPPPEHLKILVFTFGEWLIHFVGFAIIGALGGWRFDQRKGRRKARLQPITVDFPNDEPSAPTSVADPSTADHDGTTGSTAAP